MPVKLSDLLAVKHDVVTFGIFDVKAPFDLARVRLAYIDVLRRSRPGRDDVIAEHFHGPYYLLPKNQAGPARRSGGARPFP